MAVLAIWVMPFPLAVFVTMGVGFMKEVYDRGKKGNHFCWWDLLADAVGCAVGALVAMWVGVANWGF